MRMEIHRKCLSDFLSQPDDEMIVCRCEEVTKGEIRAAIHDGMFSIRELRRFLRCGMGLCQGRTCERLVKAILARELDARPSDLDDASSRAPARPIEMWMIANEVFWHG
jgi:NAD(P)H-nitrite reductase large subunit